jgi:hypothetical protein
MVSTQVLQKNGYFCVIAVEIHTHSTDQDTWPIWGFVLLPLNQNTITEPQQTACTLRTMTNTLPRKCLPNSLI